MARKHIDTTSNGGVNSPRPLSSTSNYDTSEEEEGEEDDDDTRSLSTNNTENQVHEQCSNPTGSSESDTDQPTPVARSGPSFGNTNANSEALTVSRNRANLVSSDSDNNNNNQPKNNKPLPSASSVRKTSAPPDQGTMTVETETVPAVGTIGVSSSGSLRVEKSTDNVNKTIRNKKRPHRIPQLSYSSKADLFAAKVASAVDQADSPDSDETFVYESNPSEFQSQRGQSRNPSTASLGTSLNEVASSDGFLSLHGMRRNNYNSITSNGGTPRVSSSSRVNPRKKPSTHSLRVYTSNRNAQPGSPTFLQPGSSKYHHPRIASRGGLRTPVTERRNIGHINGNDDDNDDADTETDQLMADPIRMNKRRGQHYRSASQMERNYYGDDDDDDDGNHNNNNNKATFSSCAKLGLCMMLVISLALLLGFTFGFVVASNKPLKAAHITNVTDILVSEDELMFDLTVRAFNPGFLTVNVKDLDLNVFARPCTMSKPEQDDTNGAEHYLLLGQILHFDTSLTFEGGFFNRRSHSSKGAVRLPKPGNKTEENGQEKWAKLIRHSFDLNLRGVLKYKLPISKAICSNELSQTVKVNPHQLDQSFLESN